MKKTIYLLLMALCLSACGDSKNENKKAEKALQKEVIDFHEKVMADDEKAMINKLRMDTLILKAESLKINKQDAVKISAKLTAADNAMSKWMSDLNLEFTGKSHNEVMKYLKEEQEKVKQVDLMLLDATNESAAYIQKVYKK